MLRRRLPLFALLLAVSLSASGGPLDAYLTTVRRTVLPNGLTLLHRETPGSGVVAINTWVKAGYFHEPDRVSGMAHLFEHMLLRSTKNFPGLQRISQEVAAAGGTLNASTSYEWTNYYFVLPKESVARGLELQADAFANPMFDEEELKKEAEVVIEESNRKRDNPPAMSEELMYATAFTEHRMKRWRIGSNEVLRNINRADLLAFFRTVYQPQNLVVTVIGDVPYDAVLRMVTEKFGAIPRGKLRKEEGPAEPPQTGFRYGQASADLRQGYTSIGWHTPGYEHPDAAALQMIGRILSAGRSSRLRRNAVAPGAANSAYAFSDPFQQLGLFQAHANFEEQNRAEAERRVLQEIERLKSAGPAPAELQLARNIAEAELILGMQDVLGQSEALAFAETRGGYRRLATDLAALNAVTAADVQRVARKYLTVDNMTLFHYRPKGAPELTREQALAFVRETIADVPAAPAPPSIRASDAKPARAARGVRAPEVTTLSNGATLIVEERAGMPIVAAGVYFRGGRSYENGSNAGITRLTAETMRRGTTTRSADDLDREIEFLGTQITPEILRDFFGFSTSFVARNTGPVLTLMSDVVRNPTFAAAEIAEEKDVQKAVIRRNADSGESRAAQLLYEAMYRNHPYGLPAEGHAASVDLLDGEALRAWWRANVAAEDALVVIAGDIHAEDARQLAEEHFGKLPKRTVPRAAPPMQLAASGRNDVVEYRDKKQTAIMIGFPAVSFVHADYAPLRVLQQTTSSLSGTLFTELRTKRSLAYIVYSTIVASEMGGTYYAFLASEAAKEDAARAGLLSELRRHAEDALSEERVARGKSALAGATRIEQQTSVAHVRQAARNHYLGLGLDFTDRFLAAVQKQTLDDVKKAAAKYLGGDNYVMAIVRGKS